MTNHWTMKYWSLWPTFILRSKITSHWLIIQTFDVNPSNSLHDIMLYYNSFRRRPVSYIMLYYNSFRRRPVMLHV